MATYLHAHIRKHMCISLTWEIRLYTFISKLLPYGSQQSLKSVWAGIKPP